jgi:hypothetical protein
MAVEHRLLHRMEGFLGRAQAFGRDHFAPINRWQHADAGIDSAVIDSIARCLAQHHGAGTAIALGTAFFHAMATQPVAQALKQRLGGGRIRDLDGLSVENETNNGGGRCHAV